MYTLKRPIDIKNIEFQTEENCFVSIMKSNGEYIKYVLEPSDNLITLALRIDGCNIRFIPPEKQTKDVCRLAAIHGAPLNLLPETDAEIEKIAEIVERIIEAQSENKRSRLYTDYRINGEPINPNKTFTANLIKDNVEYLQYYVNQGLKIPSFLDNNIIVDAKGNGYYSGSFKLINDLLTDIVPDSSLIYGVDGKFNKTLAKNCVSKKLEVLNEVKTEDISYDLIKCAFNNGLTVFGAMKAAPHIAFDIALNACYNVGNGQSGKERIADVFKYYEGKLPLESVEITRYRAKDLVKIMCSVPSDYIKSADAANKMLKDIVYYYKVADSSYLEECVVDFIKNIYTSVTKLTSDVVLELSDSFPEIFKLIDDDIECELAMNGETGPIINYLNVLDLDNATRPTDHVPNIHFYAEPSVRDRIYKLFGCVNCALYSYNYNWLVEKANAFRRNNRHALDDYGYDSSELPMKH